MRRKQAKQRLLFALGAGPRKKKRRKRRRPEVTFGQLTRDDVDFDSLAEIDQQYVEAVIEARKKAIQSKWTDQEELERRLGIAARDRRRYVRTDDGRLVERVITAPVSLGASDDDGDE